MMLTALKKLGSFGLFTLISLLVGCGGGGGGGGGGFLPDNSNSGSNSGGGGTYALSLALDTSSITPVQSATVTATLTLNGNPVSGEIISGSASLGSLSPSAATSLTDANGQAIFTISADTTDGAGSFTATYGSSASAIINYQISGIGSTGTSTDRISLTLSKTSISNGESNTATVTVTNSSGAPLQGVVVSGAATLGTLAPTNGSALTDANGQAIFTITGGNLDGAGIFTASYNSVSASRAYEVLAGSVSTSYNLSVALNNTNINPNQPGTVTVTLTDSTNVPVVGQIVGGSISLGALSPTSGTALTDANGQATFTINAGNSEGAGSFTASYSNTSQTINYSLSQSGSTSSYQIQLAIDDSTLTSGEYATVTATLTDNTNQPVANEILSGSLSFVGLLSPSTGTVLTDAAGQAQFRIDTGNNDGAGELVVTYQDVSSRVAFSVSGLGNGTAGANITLSLVPNAIAVGGVSQAQVTLTDTGGTPLSGQIVSGAISGSSARITYPSNGQLLTNAIGQATFVVEGVSTGAATFTASYLNNTTSTNFEVVAGSNNSSGITLSATLTNSNTGQATTSVSLFDPGTFAVTVRDANNNPIANTIVSAATTVGTLSPSNGQALTDANGVATFTLTPSITDTSGAAGTITAAVGNSATSINFSIGASNIRYGNDNGGAFTEGALDITTVNLSATGSTLVSMVAVDTNDNRISSTITVDFTSDCVVLGKASIDTGVQTIDGEARTTYNLNGCTRSSDTIRAVVDGKTIATGTVTIQPAGISSIRFDSAAPTEIAIQGFSVGGRSESATVVFTVLDSLGQPRQGVSVNLSLSNNNLGVRFGDGNTTTAQTSNAAGEITAIVNSGSLPGVVQVIATFVDNVSGLTLEQASSPIGIGAAVADQRGFDFVADILNPGGYDYSNGPVSSLTVTLRDQFSNAIPDGTVVRFATEFGIVDTNNQTTCQTTDGRCSIQWFADEPRDPALRTNQNLVLEISNTSAACYSKLSSNSVHAWWQPNRPCPGELRPLSTQGDITSHNEDFIRGARSTVIAYTDGAESFIDADGDGRFTPATEQTLFMANSISTPADYRDDLDLPEAYLDLNEDGYFSDITARVAPGFTACPLTDGCRIAYGDEETFTGFDRNLSGDLDPGNSLYNGPACSALDAGNNLCSRELVTIRKDLTLVMSGRTMYFAAIENATTDVYTSGLGVSITAGTSVTLQGLLSDKFNNPPAYGTKIEISASGGGCSVSGPSSYEVYSTNIWSAYSTAIGLSSPALGTSNSATITVTVTQPDSNGGGSQVFSFPCTRI